MAWLGPRVDVRPLLGRQHAAFLDCLRRLNRRDWARPTACPGWTVQDVAAHVLGDHVGRLSVHRDGAQPLRPHRGEDFPAFIHRLNGEWVTAARRLSPPLLIDLLTSTGDQVIAFWDAADLDAVGWPVTWAGADPAPVWLDLARDVTEYWTHHQQISEATGRPGLTRAEFLAPVLDIFLRALPHTLRTADAPEGTAVSVIVTGAAGGTWTCARARARWELRARAPARPAAVITLDTDTAWRLCTRGITPEQAAARAVTRGDADLARTALTIVSIIR